MNVVYLIQAEDSSPSIYKIGTTKNIDSRIEALKTGCPYELKLIKTINGDAHTEKRLHKKYKSFRKKGEWFEFKDIKPVVDYMENINANIENERMEGLKKWRKILADDLRNNDYGATGSGNIKNLFQISLYCMELNEENSLKEAQLIIKEIYFHLYGTWIPFAGDIEVDRSSFYNPRRLK